MILPENSIALTVPEKPQAYVNDYASLLSPGVRQKIENELAGFEKETSNQLVVAIFPSLDGQVLEDFSIKLAEKWDIGSKKNDNGVILLIFKEDRAVRIEVGYGLEGALPDATCAMIIQREIVPSFRNGDYDAGVLNAVQAIAKATRGEYQASSSGGEDAMETIAPGIFMAIFFYFFIPFASYFLIFVLCIGSLGMPGFFFAATMVLILEFFRRIFFSKVSARTFSSGRHGGSGGGFGGGGSSGGGGFSGGGGSFGGGGASGRW